VSGADAVALRCLLVAGMPLLVASVPDSGRGPQLVAALREAGVTDLVGFLGHDLPRGARVGFQLDRQELRLVDEREDALLRAPRQGIDADWTRAALRLKGTMLVVVRGDHPAPDLDARGLASAIEARARAGQVLGAIVGVAEERLNLPMVF
jgi:hypothetical protein